MNMCQGALAAIIAVLLALPCSARTEGAGAAEGKVRPLVLPVEAKETYVQMARYALHAYANADSKNPVQALLYRPKPAGRAPLPMIVYIPGNGELGDVALQFRQPTIFERVTAPEFQKRHPCFLLALTPPASATTLIGGMPGDHMPIQLALLDFIRDLCRAQRNPCVDTNRLYLTGFSYGGNGAYALGQHFPGTFAAVVPIAAIPPLPEFFEKDRPGNWWHFHNEGDYARHGVELEPIRELEKLVNEAGGDFRTGTFPADGHDAWRTVWKEDGVWDWMFSKSLKGAVRRPLGGARKADAASVSLAAAVCTASQPGSDPNHGPERVVDGLDATWYESKTPFTKKDWWQVDLQEPVRGKFTLVSGNGEGSKILKGGIVEASADGGRWLRVGTFDKNGVCWFVARNSIRYLRVRTGATKPQSFCLRRLSLAKDAK